MVSGIGPSETLDQLNIPVLSDRPGVRQNMFVSSFNRSTRALTTNPNQDHILLGSVYPVNLTTHSALTSDPSYLAASIQSYNENRTGILTNCGGDLLGKAHSPPFLWRTQQTLTNHPLQASENSPLTLQPPKPAHPSTLPSPPTGPISNSSSTTATSSAPPRKPATTSPPSPASSPLSPAAT